jgi:hypothetical protein
MSESVVSLAPAHHGEALIDAHSPLHAIVGFAAGVMGVEPHVAMLAFIGARIVEQALKAGTKEALFEREQGQSLGNEMTDLLFELAGLQAGERLRARLVAEPEPLPAAGVGNAPLAWYPGWGVLVQ